MIICYLGAFGSGKTISMVRDAVTSNGFCYTNFDLLRYKKWKRIYLKDILKYDDKGKIIGSNWEFWEEVRLKHQKKNESYNIYLDEIHNVLFARAHATQLSKRLLYWVFQCRKVLNDDCRNNLIISSQDWGQVDIALRRLMQVIIECRRIKLRNGTEIVKHYFYNGCMNYERGIRCGKPKGFVSNPFFKDYDYKALVKFGEDEVFL